MAQNKKTLKLSRAWTPFSWDAEPPVRMVPKSQENGAEHYRRSGLLGNSVVPDAVRAAFLMLWEGLDGTSIQETMAKTAWTFKRPVLTAALYKSSDMAGGVLISGMHKIKAFKVPKPLERSGIVLDPTVFTSPKPPNPAQTVQKITERHPMRGWATPRKNNSVANVLTLRTNNDLGTQLRFEASTPDTVRDGYPAPEWVEWLMGFPPGWTSAERAS